MSGEPQEHWPALSYLEGLRPAGGEEVELALIASYSADLGTIGAALLALAGLDSDAGRGSPSDFADAVERLRGKVRIVVQRGRLARLRKTPRIAAVLDQFVREVGFDEASHSWHPKAALVRTRSAEAGPRWRLWIGSRNLTECVNRDIGLLLVSASAGGTRLPGAADLARSLAERADLPRVVPGRLANQVGTVAWRAPAGVRVERLRWSPGTGGETIPIPPAGADQIAIVSPFVDTTFLSRQIAGSGKPAVRRLLTTMHEIDRIGPPLARFDDLLALDAPEYPAGDPAPDTGDPASAPGAPVADEQEEIGRGLHAKLLYWRAGRKRTLWLGSANATMRAWTGRNAELTAELEVSEAVAAGLQALLDGARCITAPSEALAADERSCEEEALKRARAQVAARWAAVLSSDEDGLRLIQPATQGDEGPHPDDPDILLEVGALHATMQPWPRGHDQVALGEIPPGDLSELVQLRVSKEALGLSWFQRASAEPAFGEERDRAAFVRFLGIRGFLLWVAGLLAGDDREGEGDWTAEQPSERALGPGLNAALDPALPTLEDVLAAWSRDADKFQEIERRVSDYLPAVLAQADREDADAADLLRRFEALWQTLRAGLGKSRRRRR